MLYCIMLQCCTILLHADLLSYCTIVWHCFIQLHQVVFKSNLKYFTGTPHNCCQCAKSGQQLRNRYAETSVACWPISSLCRLIPSLWKKSLPGKLFQAIKMFFSTKLKSLIFLLFYMYIIVLYYIIQNFKNQNEKLFQKKKLKYFVLKIYK